VLHGIVTKSIFSSALYWRRAVQDKFGSAAGCGNRVIFKIRLVSKSFLFATYFFMFPYGDAISSFSVSTEKFGVLK